MLPEVTLSGEAGYAERELEMRAEPQSDAVVIGKIPKGGQFELLKRQMAWAQIASGNQQGWVLFFFLVNGSPPNQAPPARAMAEALGFASSRQGTGNITSSIGIRGLDEEQLKAAKFNEPELRKLETFLVPGPAAAGFAREGALAQRRVEYLTTPVAEGQNSTFPKGAD
jgi:hypothetical protein